MLTFKNGFTIKSSRMSNTNKSQKAPIYAGQSHFGKQENTCSCEKCAGMCRVSPCYPTPQEVVKAVRHGYKDKFMITGFIDQKFGIIWPLIAPEGIDWRHGPHIFHRCVFLNSDMKCDLHNTGFKPLEGRLLNHESTTEECEHIRLEILLSWNTQEAFEVVKNIFPESAEDFVLVALAAKHEYELLLKLG